MSLTARPLHRICEPRLVADWEIPARIASNFPISWRLPGTWIDPENYTSPCASSAISRHVGERIASLCFASNRNVRGQVQGLQLCARTGAVVAASPCPADRAAGRAGAAASTPRLDPRRKSSHVSWRGCMTLEPDVADYLSCAAISPTNLMARASCCSPPRLHRGGPTWSRIPTPLSP